MAFVSLPDALKRVGVDEAELKKLVQQKGLQVFMSGEGAQKGICFKEEDLAQLVTDLNLAPIIDEPMDLDLSSHSDDMDLSGDLPEEEGAIDIDLDDDLDLGADLDLEEEVVEESSPEENVELEDLDMDLDVDDLSAVDSASVTAVSEGDDLILSEEDDLSLEDGSSLDLDFDADESLSLDLEGGDETLAVEPAPMDSVFELDDTMIDESGDETLSFDDGDQTLSIGEDGDESMTLDFAGSDNLKLPDESFSLDDEDNTLNLENSGGADLDDESAAALALDDDEEVEDDEDVAFRPTTEIVDEDSVGVIFPFVGFLCFATVVFNGCVMFGLIQDLNLEGGISYGKNFFSFIRDLAEPVLPR